MGSGQIKDYKSIFKIIWKDSSNKHRYFIVLSFILMIISKISIISTPLIFKECIDHLNQQQIQDLHYPLFLISMYIAIGIIGIIFSEIKEYLFTVVSQDFIKHISHQAFDHIQKLPLCFHEQRKKGSLARSLDRGIMAIEQIIKQFIYGILPAICEIILILGIILSLTNYTYSIVFISGMLFYTIYTYVLTQWRTQLLRQVNDSEDRISDQAMDSMLNVDVVKTFTNEALELTKYDALISRYKQNAIQCQKSLSFLNIGQQLCLSLTLGGVLTLSLVNMFNHNITLGTFVMLNAYALQIFCPVYSLSTVYKFIRESVIAMEKMLAIFEVPDEFSKQYLEQQLHTDTSYGIQFTDITFAYAEKNVLLHNFNFFVNMGEKIAIVGYSGQGKSTVAKILLRLYEIQSGTITLDNININSLSKKDLRKNISYVSQDVLLFNDTIYENIKYGNLQASSSDIIKAAQYANIHTFITSLPNNYKTIVGERGVKLSGGERQRIALARAFLKNAPVLILDEATSHLDNTNEQEIYKNINQQFFDKTVIIIAHRLSTLKNVDRICIMDKGQIIDSGKHDELLLNSRIYQELWNIEAGL